MKTQVAPSALRHVSSAKLKIIRRRFSSLYGVERADPLMERFHQLVGRYGVGAHRGAIAKPLTQRDALLITYADMVSDDGKSPLATLGEFCTARLKGAFSAIHLLPFYLLLQHLYPFLHLQSLRPSQKGKKITLIL